MKKIFIIVASIILISTNISFAYAPSSSTDEFVSELEMIQNDLMMATKSLMCIENKSKEEMDIIKQSLANDSSKINYSFAAINRLYKNNSDTQLRKEISAISEGLSSYSLATNSLLLYIDNPNDTNQLFEAVGAIQNGRLTLEYLKSLKK
ncbi:hypothetical protein [Faecalimicrobium dakarense]|uniref:hypothetical protein n=1 Tax=Faecalimicrobium dakarense TaxID=1301100 RepID=UPI0004B31789|nr:hypothetical protein [[Clostridium] dakarense]